MASGCIRGIGILVAAVAFSLLLVVRAPAVAQEEVKASEPFWTGRPGATAFSARMERHLEQARERWGEVTSFRGSRTVENTLGAFDEVRLEIDNAEALGLLMQQVHPDSAVREAARRGALRAAGMRTDLWLDRSLYDALATVDTADADSESRHYLRRVLRDFRRAGVDRDSETRRRIRAARAELDSLSQLFGRNVSEDRDTVLVGGPNGLKGLPEDWIAAHPPNREGAITVTMDYPDVLPVLTYAEDGDLRRRVLLAFLNRAVPENLPVLDAILGRRRELAPLLGFQSWADAVIGDDMAGSGANAVAFVDRIVEASGPRAQREVELLLARLRENRPDARAVPYPDWAYISELVRRERFELDARTIRPYFAYENVKRGVLDLFADLLGLEFRPLPGAPTWHPSVEPWEVYEGGKLIGRFYLDMHPRRDKFTHAGIFHARTGVGDRQLPEAVMVCNFPGGMANDPGLLEHGELRTFLHEFGHLVHFILAGRRPFFGTGAWSVEADFSEAPSQMLEEWAWDPEVLGHFARHYETGEPLAGDVLQRLRAAEELTKGLRTREQMAYARIALRLHEPSHERVASDSVVLQALREVLPVEMPREETHFQASFGHLADDWYSAGYYLYMWSETIAKDLFTRFAGKNILSPEVGSDYRRKILEAGASAPADQLIEDFLGRPFDLGAWTRWLNERDLTTESTDPATDGGAR